MKHACAKNYRDLYEQASMVSVQLNAMLSHTYGCSHEAFHDMSDQLKGNYLWACANLAEQLSGLIEALGKAKP